MFVKNKKSSQIEDITNYLRKYKKITSMDAIRNFSATRLSGIIFILRNKGFVIRTEIKTVKNRYGGTSNIAVYHLEKDGDL